MANMAKNLISEFHMFHINLEEMKTSFLRLGSRKSSGTENVVIN